jgi:hypothetical protein
LFRQFLNERRQRHRRPQAARKGFTTDVDVDFTG